MNLSSFFLFRWIVALVDAGLIVIAIPVLVGVGGLSVMAFDAPEAEHVWQPWAFVLGVGAVIAAVLIGSAVGAVRAWRRGASWVSLVWASVPLLFLLAFFFVIQLM
jgi:hypothetical protein